MLSDEFGSTNRMSQLESAWQDAQQKKRSNLKKSIAAVALILLALVGYFGWRHVENDRQRKEALAAQKLADEKQQQNEAAAAQNILEQQRRDEAALQADERRKREEAAQQAELRRVKDLERAKNKRDEAHQALSTGILAAIEAKKKEDWAQIQELLARVLILPENSDHPSLVIAETLLREANEQLEKRRQFDSKMAGAEAALEKNKFEDALTHCQDARAIWPQSPRLDKIVEFEKQAQDGLAVIAKNRVEGELDQKYRTAMDAAQRLYAAFLRNATSKASVEAAINQALVLKPNDEAALALSKNLTPEKELVFDLGGGVTMELVLISSGTFQMGSPINEEGHDENEIQHTVSIKEPFFLGKYAVTQEQYEAIMKENPSVVKGGAKYPVQNVAWEQAMKFCDKLGLLEGRLVKLPTEAQWEYACRAGTTTPFYLGETIGTDKANYDGNVRYGKGLPGEFRRKPMPVGSFAPNAFGLYDMHGNVSQWCLDTYIKRYETLPAVDPCCIQGIGHVLRGGSYSDNARRCRSSSRLVSTIYPNSGWGFRIAVVAPEGFEANAVVAPVNAVVRTDAVSIQEKKLVDGAAIIATNSGGGFNTVTLELTLHNAVSNKPNPLSFMLKPGESSTVAEIKATGADWRYTYSWRFCYGNSLAKHDANCIYELPYESGLTFKVIQGGRDDIRNQSYDIAWSMPEGTKVYAARGGKVVYVRIDSNEGGADRNKYLYKANLLAIEHSDGTVGVYANLKFNGAFVKVGQNVNAGDLICLSGATGFAASPQLSFHVQIPIDGKSFNTVPLKFKIEGGKAEPLQWNKSYIAPVRPKPG